MLSLFNTESSSSYAYKAFTLSSLNFMITTKKIDLNPSYQRDIAWGMKNMQQLIETILKGLPIPMIFIAPTENNSKIKECVDGKNRLTSIKKYFNDEFTVSIGNENIDDIVFSKLHPDLQEEIRQQQVQVCEYSKISELEKRDFFSRIQKGVGLSAVEQIHALDNHNLVLFVRTFSKTQSTLIEQIWKTNRFSDYTQLFNIISMIMRKKNVGSFSKKCTAVNVTAGHSNGLMPWIIKQSFDADYSNLNDILLNVIKQLVVICSNTTYIISDKYKNHFLYDVARYIVINEPQNLEHTHRQVVKFINTLNTRFVTDIPSQSQPVESYFTIISHGAKSGQYAKNIITNRYETFQTYFI